jgi:starch synthase
LKAPNKEWLDRRLLTIRTKSAGIDSFIFMKCLQSQGLSCEKVLFATSEAYPLVKTGGLGDVSNALPSALKGLGFDIRLVLPAYRHTLTRVGRIERVRELSLPGKGERIGLFEGAPGSTSLKCYLVDAPSLFDRPGGPYAGPDGQDWPDNAERFAVFARAVVELAQDRAGSQWQPDLVHCNDWQTGLIPPLLARGSRHPASVFTIHNLAYQGLFDWHTFADLRLPPDLWHPEAMEFYGRFSFIKGGLVFSDRLTTVSPTYALEIQTPEFGYGLDGLLRHRAQDLVGILNGIDYSIWDPRCDPYIAERYDPEDLAKRSINKRDLQQYFKLRTDPDALLMGSVGRLVEQKGIDLILHAIPLLYREDVQLVVLGSGDKALAEALKGLAGDNPGRIGVYIGYDEALAHRIIAGADVFLMPSRYEPCGLNQMYSLRYGTIPIVRSTGGLADTVVDTTPETLQAGSATGFTFKEPTPAALASAIRRALFCYLDPKTWSQIQSTGMAQDFSWERSARAYADVYRHLC